MNKTMMTQFLLGVSLIAVFLPFSQSGSSVPNGDRMVIHSCMYGFALSNIMGNYSEVRKDRNWQYGCVKVNDNSDDRCQWTRKYPFI